MSHPLKSLLQHAPPSKLQLGLLFSSSQYWSSAHCGEPQPDGGGVKVVVVVALGLEEHVARQKLDP